MHRIQLFVAFLVVLTLLAQVSYSQETKAALLPNEQSLLQKDFESIVSTNRDIRRHIGVSEGLTTVGQIGSNIERPNLHDAVERLEKTDSDEAWLNCKRVAMDFGVFVPADPN